MLSIYMGFSACLGCGSFYSISCHTCQSGISFDVVGVLFWVPVARGYLLLQRRNPESSCADIFILSSEVCLNGPFLYHIFLSLSI